jgi:hypothetical protein
MLACLRKKRRASQAAALDVQGVDADKNDFDGAGGRAARRLDAEMAVQQVGLPANRVRGE